MAGFTFLTTPTEETLRYPVGKFQFDPEGFPANRDGYVQDLEEALGQLNALVSQADATWWQTPYRPGGWTAAQVMAHLADSQANGLWRVKTAVMEPDAVIQAYDENTWLAKSESARLPVLVNLMFVIAVLGRIQAFYKSLTYDIDFNKPVYHTGHKAHRPAQYWLQMFVWHPCHHVAHIQLSRNNA